MRKQKMYSVGISSSQAERLDRLSMETGLKKSAIFRRSLDTTMAAMHAVVGTDSAIDRNGVYRLQDGLSIQADGDRAPRMTPKARQAYNRRAD